MCRSGTQVELPRRLAMSQVGLVDDHTLHQPCVQSLSFKSTLALWMPAHWAPSLWPTVAIPQRKKWHLPGGRITSGDLPLRTHAHTHICLLYDGGGDHEGERESLANNLANWGAFDHASHAPQSRLCNCNIMCVFACVTKLYIQATLFA